MDEPDWITLSGYDHRYARVRFATVQAPHALALIDTNSDGREIALVVLARRGDAWEVADEDDDVSDQFQGWSDDFVWAYGRARPRTVVPVTYAGEVHDVVVDDRDWWTFFHPAGPQADGTLTPPQRLA